LAVLKTDNVYYQNAEVKTSYQRTGPFTSGCGVSGGGNCSGPPWAIFPNTLFMFGNMEGVVNPYSTAPATLNPPTNLRILSVGP
jgi:hypothetical protein